MDQAQRGDVNPFYRLSADNPFFQTASATICATCACATEKSSSKSSNSNENNLKVQKEKKVDLDTTRCASKTNHPESSKILRESPDSSNPTKFMNGSQRKEFRKSCFSRSPETEHEKARAVGDKSSESSRRLQQDSSDGIERKPRGSSAEHSNRCFTFISIGDKCGTDKTLSFGGRAFEDKTNPSPSACPRPRSNTFVISETRSAVAAKMKENLKLNRDKSKLSKSLAATNLWRHPGQRKVMSETCSQPQKDSMEKKHLKTTSLDSKEGTQRFESMLCNLRKCSPRQKYCSRVTESKKEKCSEKKTTLSGIGIGTPYLPSNTERSPSSSCRSTWAKVHLPTSHLSTSNKNLTTTTPPPTASNSRPKSEPAYSSNHLTTTMSTSQSQGASPNRRTRVSRPVASKAARNDKMTNRARAQSHSEMTVKQILSSSANTNATGNRLYIQRKTPGGSSNHGVSRPILQVRQEDSEARSSLRQEKVGRLKSSVLSAREDGRKEKVTVGSQNQRAAEVGRFDSSRVKLGEKSRGKRLPTTRSVTNLCNPTECLMETNEKTEQAAQESKFEDTEKRSDQVSKSPLKGNHNQIVSGCISDTFKKPKQVPQHDKMLGVISPRERKKSEKVKSLPPETDLAFRRPSIHQSLININKECEEVIDKKYELIFILFQVIELMMSLMQDEAISQFQEKVSSFEMQPDSTNRLKKENRIRRTKL